MADDDDDKETLPAVLAVPERTTAGTWARGQSGNIRGRPVGAINRFSRDIMQALAVNWAEHGNATIEVVRLKDPVAWLTIMTRLLPREIHHMSGKLPGTDMSEEELDSVLATIRLEIGKRRN